MGKRSFLVKVTFKIQDEKLCLEKLRQPSKNSELSLKKDEHHLENEKTSNMPLAVFKYSPIRAK